MSVNNHGHPYMLIQPVELMLFLLFLFRDEITAAAAAKSLFLQS